MPTITVHQADVEALLGDNFSPDVFESQLELVKGELDDYDPATGEARVELNDTNRPDLWCIEGIARQIATHRDGKPGEYDFLANLLPATRQLLVDKGVANVRPYIGACIARGVTVDDRLLTQLIQTQEKICDVFGQKRRTIAIGVYDASQLAFPLHYQAVSPSEAAFVPLGMEDPLTLAQIVEMHPKGQQYGSLVEDHGRWPLLKDDAGTVLSFPPVTNSADVGEVKVGDSELFLEVTGTDLRMVTLVINILAANMADRGAQIEPLETVFPDATVFGKNVVMPRPLERRISVPFDQFERALGDPLSGDEITRQLTAYGYHTALSSDAVQVSVPSFRDDILHPVDVIEDFAISRGYESFAAQMPTDFTVGSLLDTEHLSDQVREHMVGLGFQEVLSNILVNREELTDMMGLHGANLVSVSNVMSASYSVLRNAILPSLLRVEQESGRAYYPHALFEVGEVAKYKPDAPMGSETRISMAAFLAHAEANFSELAARMEMLLYYLNLKHELEPMDHASYIPGRAGRIMVDGWQVGIIGELAPEVLFAWGITVPAAAMEMDLTALISR